MANVFRAFFDDTARLSSDADQAVDLRKLYDHVLRADSEIEAITASLPRYLRQDREFPDASGRLPCFIYRLRYHFTISIAHKVLNPVGSRIYYPVFHLWYGAYSAKLPAETCDPQPIFSQKLD